MALMNWNTYFVTGIDIVDLQHQHLVKLINESAPVLALAYQKNPDKAGELLNELTQYAVYHFKTEDELMRYYGIDPQHHQHHLEIHGEFARTVSSMRELYEQGENVTGGELLSFLANWLVFHILGEDQGMARQIHAIEAGESPAKAYERLAMNQSAPAHNALTQALVDLYALMTEQNQHLLEMNHELQEHREHLEELVNNRTIDLEAARKAAETANLAKSAFIANLSHEIRTPMNAIVGLTWTLQAETTDPAQKGKLEQVSNSTQQLLGIINDLIDISRIESAQLSLEPLDFDLRQIINHIIANHAGKARQKGLTFSTQVPPQIPALLHGDPVRIAQIISNFVSNAIKFTAHGSVQLNIALQNGSTPEQVTLRCSVEDTGIGISPAQGELLFQPFEQLDQSTRRRFGGTGLGLAISQRLAEMMGGKVGMSSQPGRGSIFHFEIPLTVVGPPSHTEKAQIKSQISADPTIIDWPIVEAILLALSRLLAEDDIQCISLWRENAEMLKAAFDEPALQLEAELNHYNFETALLMVQDFLGILPDQALCKEHRSDDIRICEI